MRRAYLFLFSSTLLALSPACGPDSDGGSGRGGATPTGTGGSSQSGGAGAGTGGSSQTGGAGAGTGGGGAGGAETGGAAGRAGSGTAGGGAGGSAGASVGGASGSGGTSGAAGSSGAGTGGAAGNGAGGVDGGTKDGGAGAAGRAGGNIDAGPTVDAPWDAPSDAPRPQDVGGDVCMGRGAENVELGTPTDADLSDDVILTHPHFVVSYNPNKNDPNWVSWHLNASDIGTTPRQDNFSPDPLLPAMYYRVKTADYTGSGYDRGHVLPSAENTASLMQNSDSFLMTNIMPQYHELNAGPWEGLESFERGLAVTDQKEVYIVAGGIYDATPPTIGPGIAVPKSCFKIVIVLDAGKGPCDITPQTPIYAVIMPNTTTTTGTKWGAYTTSIDDVEMQTGYDFLSGVPLGVQSMIESVITKAP